MKNYSTHLVKIVYPKIQKELGLKNALAVPRLKKIMVNVGIGTRIKVSKDFSDIEENLSAITGQKPVVRKAKKAISNFKLKVNSPNGLVTTLRGKRMLDFFNRLVNVAIPRIRDFHGFSEKGFDGRGNYSIGIRDCTIFPEARVEDISKLHGMSVTIVTTANTNDAAMTLLSNLNFPFKKTKS